MILKGKKIILGVTGSIAIYKSCELLRKLREEGAEVKVIMTKNAAKFISPLTFQTLSGNPVYLEMFCPLEDNTWTNHSELVHIKLTQWADCMLVAPATANIISKTACGISDDLLSTTLTSFQGPIILTPAMDEGMYKNVIFKDNLSKLSGRGYHIIPATKGLLASGKIGEGRFPPIEDIIQSVRDVLLTKEDFQGIKVLVTAGGTQEFLDPVRFIGNASSGKMGYALAEAAKLRGAEVKLISAPTLLPFPNGIKIISVVTASQMREEVIKNFSLTDVLIMAAAVGDFRSKKLEKQKRTRANGQWDIQLVPNADILLEVGKQKKNKITVGFSIETENQIIKAKEKLRKKNLDLIVANDITLKNSGFCSDTNKAIFIDKNSKVEKLSLLSKKELANKILDKIQNIGRNRWKRE